MVKRYLLTVEVVDNKRAEENLKELEHYFRIWLEDLQEARHCAIKLVAENEVIVETEE